MRKTTPKPGKPKTTKATTTKPLTISIHGDGIDIDATLGDGEGIKSFMTAIRGAVPAVMGQAAATKPAPPPADEDLQLYADAMLNIIAAAQTPELLHKLAELLELGQLAIKDRIIQVSAAPPPSTTNGTVAPSATA